MFVRPGLAYRRNSRVLTRGVTRGNAWLRACNAKQCNSSFVRSFRGFYDGLTGRMTASHSYVKDTPGSLSNSVPDPDQMWSYSTL